MYWPRFLSRNLSGFANKWKDIGASPVVRDWVADGVTLPFTCNPFPLNNNKSRKFLQKECDWLAKEVSYLLKSGAIVECTDCVPQFVSPHVTCEFLPIFSIICPFLFSFGILLLFSSTA